MGRIKDLWFDDEKDSLDVPLHLRGAELARRKAARLEALDAIKEGIPIPPYDIRIWWKGKWEKRVMLPELRVQSWRMRGRELDNQDGAFAAARPSIANCLIAEPGDKMIPANASYIKRILGMGLGVFSNDNKAEGTIVGSYVGRLYRAGNIDLVHTRNREYTHRVSLRYRTHGLPNGWTGIDGAILSEPVDGKSYDLKYFVNNGSGSLFNSLKGRHANCKLVVEYPSYHADRPGENVWLDDQYCAPDVPMGNRVLKRRFCNVYTRTFPLKY